MKCPRTGTNMKEVEINQVKVDISEGCGGIWFDNFEFEKFDEAHESAGDKLIDLMASFSKGVPDLSKRLNCPRCQDTVLMRRFASPLRKIQIDQCPSCSGIWLDAGELASFRKFFPSEQDRKKAGEELIERNIMPMLRVEAQKGQAELEKARRIASMLRFICPSYYIPGKQEDAAF
ncbi:MAG: zf-TFIIB domain-containing protein [Candidatus Omnitrophota bacterium]